MASLSRESTSRWWLNFNQIFLFIALIALYLIIPTWPNLNLYTRLVFASTEISFGPYLSFTFFLYLLMMIIPVSLMGMTLPLLFQHLKEDSQYLSETAGRMYAYNSVGATLGAILLGYLAFFIFEADQVFLILIGVAALCLSLVFSLVNSFSIVGKLSPLIVATALIFILPNWDDHNFVPGRFTGFGVAPGTFDQLEKAWESFDKDNHKILYSNYGPNTFTTVTESSKGERTVYVNTKADASAPGDSFTRTSTALIPLSLAEKHDDIFIIGLGAGLSAGIASSFKGTKSVKVTEIAAGVIEALPFFDEFNFDIKDNMDKITLVNDDAYKVLKNETMTYDLIFSEPSNTWVTGVEKIYTEEFLTEVSKRLNPQGIYSQWFPLFSMSDDSFLSILYNFKRAFKYVTLWTGGGRATIIIASHEPLKANLDLLEKKFAENEQIYSSIKRTSGKEILFHQIWTDAAISDLANGATITHSTYHPTLAYQSGRAFFSNGIVRFEDLAKKYFVYNKEVKKSDEVRHFPVNGSEQNDQLLWQTVEDQLSEEFFTIGNSFLNGVDSFVAGKLSLAKERRFPSDLSPQYKDQMEGVKNKYDQYKYLLGTKEEKKPQLVNKKGYLATELFNRYLHLISLREPANITKVLSQIPRECDPKLEACFATKIEVLRFLYPDMNNDLISISEKFEVDKELAQGEIETLFKNSVKY